MHYFYCLLLEGIRMLGLGVLLSDGEDMNGQRLFSAVHRESWTKCTEQKEQREKSI